MQLSLRPDLALCPYVQLFHAEGRVEVAAWDTLLGLGLLAAAVTMLFRRRGLPQERSLDLWIRQKAYQSQTDR